MLKNRWLIIILFLPHLNISFYNIEPLDNINSVLRLLIVLFSIIVILYTKRLNKFHILTILFFILLIFSSIYNNNLNVGFIYGLANILGLIIATYYFIRWDFKEFIFGLYYLYTFLIFVNFITVIAGGFQINGEIYFLLGEKNHLIFSVIPYIAISYIYSYYFYNKMRFFPILMVFLGIISVIFAGSGTGIVVSLFVIFFMLMPRFSHPSLKTYLFIYIISFIVIVILRLHDILFGDFIVNVLEKDVTFTGRTRIWDVVIEKIKQNWLLGLGQGNTVVSDNFVGLSEVHNGLLEITLMGGIIALVGFLLILNFIARKLNNFKKEALSQIVSLSIFLFLITGLQESVFLKREFWILLMVGCSIGVIIKHIDKPLKTKDQNNFIKV